MSEKKLGRNVLPWRRIHMSLTMIMVLAALLIWTPIVSAAETPCVLSYQTFETAVPHIDAEICPDGSDSEKIFCRISVGRDHAHVFYFSYAGNKCLLKVESFDDEEVELKFKKQ